MAALYISYNAKKFIEVKDYSHQIVADFIASDGVGIAFREGVDFCYNGERTLKFDLRASAKVNVRVEFKTVNSAWDADHIVNIQIPSAGIGRISIPIPTFFSPITEIVFAVLKQDNETIDRVTYIIDKMAME